MGRPRKKGEYVEEKARAKARLDAEDEHDAKLFSGKGKKRLVASVASHLGKLIDRLDAMETGAIFIGTYLVHDILIKSPQIVAQANDLLVRPSGVEQMLTWGPIYGSLNIVYHHFIGQPVEKGAKEMVEQTPDLIIWAVSFLIAFLVIKHFGLILEGITSMGKGLVGLGMMLLGGV